MHHEGGILDVAVLTFVLLFLAAMVSIATKRVRVPFSVALVLLGLAIGIAARVLHEAPGFLGTVASSVSGFHLTPDLILFIFLPTLIFESAYNLNVRRLLKNLAPILTLAIPGLLISTAIIGGILHLVLGMDWLVALLFGALVSATDPVAVIALFAEVGAPKRLVTLVEGESLFNDATAIVVFSIILGLIEGATASAPAVVGRFFYVFLGGTLVGIVLGMIFSKIIEKVENDPLVEITLTTVLAYLSFIVADHFLHVSGVMSTVAAGLTVGSYGRTKISAGVLEFMHSFWATLAYVANAIIFLLVGIFLPNTLAGFQMGSVAGPLLLALAAAFLARGLVVVVFMPLLKLLRLTEPIDRGYQAVIFWGGLRGAIALALALSLLGRSGLGEGVGELLLALTAGVVLFTLLVNGTTIRTIVRFFGLDRETSAERLLKGESMLEVQKAVEADLQALGRGGIVQPQVLQKLVGSVQKREEELRADLAGDSLSEEERLVVHRVQCIGMEKTHFMRLFAEGNLSETATRDLSHEADVRTDLARKGAPVALAARGRRDPGRAVVAALRAVPGLRWLAQRLQTGRVATLYETARGRFLAACEVQAEMERMRASGTLSDANFEALDHDYREQRQRAEEEMVEIADQFPEYVEKVQELVGTRVSLNTELHGYDRLLEQGIITEQIHERLKVDVEGRLRALERRPVRALDLEPRALLSSVPLFRGLPGEDLDAVAECLRSRPCMKDEVLFREGEHGDTMFLIGRGVVRVWRGGSGGELLATLTAGNFVGEMALLRPAPRTATAETATVASLLELKKSDLDRVMERFPQVKDALERAYQERLAALRGHGTARQAPGMNGGPNDE